MHSQNYFKTVINMAIFFMNKVGHDLLESCEIASLHLEICIDVQKLCVMCNNCKTSLAMLS